MIPNVNLRVVAVTKLSQDCKDHCCHGKRELALGAAFCLWGDDQKHLLNSPITNVIAQFLVSWGRGVFQLVGKTPQGSRAVQVTQLCPSVLAQGASPQHLQLLSASQGLLEAPENSA